MNHFWQSLIIIHFLQNNLRVMKSNNKQKVGTILLRLYPINK